VNDAAIRRARRALASVETQPFDLFQIAQRSFGIVFGTEQTVDQIDEQGPIR